MHDIAVYGIGALLICFTVTTFFLARLDQDLISENYELKQDPFLYLIGTLLLGGIGVITFFPHTHGAINSYGYFDIIAPIFFAVLIYLCYMLDIHILTNFITFMCALIMSYAQPDNFQLFPEILTPFQDKLIVALLLFITTKGLGYLNGLGAIASLQFIAVMISAILLMYIGLLPQILGAIALSYLGVMLAFVFFSWPTEKLVMNNAGFSSLGFILGCFMLNGATEYVEMPLIVSASYMFTEFGIILYTRFIEKGNDDYLPSYSSYYRISEKGKYELGVVHGVLKILIIDVMLSLAQTASSDRLSFFVFAIALNMWFLSILSGNTKPEDMISLSSFGKKAVKGIFSKKQKNSKKREKKKH